MSLIFKVLIWGVIITKLVFILIFFLWSKFGKDLKAEKTKEVPNKNAWFMETACEGKSIDEKQVSDDLPTAGETKSTSKEKELSRSQAESDNNLLQYGSNKNKEYIRDIDIVFD